MNISTTDAQGLYTKKLIDVYKQKTTPTGFLRSFFKDKESPTLEVSIEVQRNFEKIANPVVRGTDGNRNQFSRSTEKIFIPKYYREWFDATQLQLYDRLYGATEISDSMFAAYINSVADHIVELQNKIERSQELQCAQVLETGIISLGDKLEIDYKRKAASLVAYAVGNNFADNTKNPFTVFETGCTFLRQVGKATGGKFIAIMGSDALSALLANTIFTSRQNLFNMALDSVNAPLMKMEGCTYHGTLTAGSYKVELWAYPQYYDNGAGTSTAYVNPKKITIIPEAPRFVMAYGAVPQLIEPNTPPRMGKFIVSEYLDKRGKARIVDLESCCLAVPVGVDQMYTVQVLA